MKQCPYCYKLIEETTEITTNTNKKENDIMNNNKTFTVEELVKAITMAVNVVNNPVEKVTTTVPTEDKNHWATTSKFYGQEICGIIYNPYLFSRFVPARYMKMMQRTKFNNYNVNAVIAFNYDEEYAIKVVKKEVNKLAMLEKRDKVTFEDRKWLYEINLVKQIIKEYIDECIKYIDRAKVIRRNKINYKNIKGVGCIPCGDFIETIQNHKIVTILEESTELIALKKELTDFAKNIQNCKTYAQISNQLATFKIIKLKCKPTKSFIEAYKRRGAYETLKYLVAFGNCSFKGYAKGKDSLIAVMNYVKEKEAYQLHAALKECIEENQFDIFNPVFDERNVNK